MFEPDTPLTADATQSNAGIDVTQPEPAPGNQTTTFAPPVQAAPVPVRGAPTREQASALVEELSRNGMADDNNWIRVPRSPLERYVGTPGRTDLIAMPFATPRKVVRLHYSKAWGRYFVCFDGECCEDNGMPDIVYGYVIFKYDIDNSGSVISQNLDIRALITKGKSQDQLDACMKLGTIENDIMASTSNDQYKNLTFQAGMNCTWKTFSRAKEYFDRAVTLYNKTLSNVIGQKVTVEEYRTAKMQNFGKGPSSFGTVPQGRSGVVIPQSSNPFMSPSQAPTFGSGTDFNSILKAPGT